MGENRIRVARDPENRNKGRLKSLKSSSQTSLSCFWREYLLKQKTEMAPSNSAKPRLDQHTTSPSRRQRFATGCELIVKFKCTKAYKDVERVLQDDQATGMYLSGSCRGAVSEEARQQQVARGCFELTKEQMGGPPAEAVRAQMNHHSAILSRGPGSH